MFGRTVKKLFLFFFCGTVKLICKLRHTLFKNLLLRQIPILGPSGLFLKNLRSATGKFAYSVVCGNTYATLPPPYRNDWLTLTFNCLFAIQSAVSISIKSPIKKLLVSINQSDSGNLIYFYYKFFDRAQETNTYAIKSKRPCLQIF